MHCKAARKAIFEDGLGLLADGPRAGLERHCRVCATCSDARQASNALDGSLKALGSRPVPPVDIRRKIMDRVGAGPPPTTQGFAWALAAAVAASAGFVALTFLLAPHALPMLRGTIYGGIALVRAADPLWALASVLVQAGSFLIRSVLSLAETWSRLQPLTFGILFAGSCFALTTSLVLVGRSFFLERSAGIRKEL